jgi:hypothetical protein
LDSAAKKQQFLIAFGTARHGVGQGLHVGLSIVSIMTVMVWWTSSEKGAVLSKRADALT